MSKKLKTALICLLSVLLLAGCGLGEDEDYYSGPVLVSAPISSTDSGMGSVSVIGEEEYNPIKEGLEVIGERKEVDGKKQSYLTGEWKAADIVNRRPMAVMIPNNKAALPQYGISKASIIYEAPMESLSCTRLMGVFEDYDELDHVGPVRSSRLYFLEEAMSLDAIYCNWGLAVPYVGPVINTDRVDNISAGVAGIDSPSDEAFDRDEKRKAAGYATEYTGIMNIEGYNQAVKRHGYSTTYHGNYINPFEFADDGYIAVYDDKYYDVTKFAPGGIDSATAGGGYASTMPYFVYNEQDHLYYRYQSGKPQIDEYNGEQLTCTNVIFKVCYWRYADKNGYLSVDVEGSGRSYLFTEGKMIWGRWEKDVTDNSRTRFYEEDGTEFVLNQGKTWVCIILDDYHDCIYFE